MLHTGDMSDFGLKLEFEKQRDILSGLKVPYVCLLGNHDCLVRDSTYSARYSARRISPLPQATYVSCA